MYLTLNKYLPNLMGVFYWGIQIYAMFQSISVFIVFQGCQDYPSTEDKRWGPCKGGTLGEQKKYRGEVICILSTAC